MDIAAYYLRYVAIYMMFGLTMGMSSIEKIMGSAPDWFIDQFQDTLVGSLVGMEIAWRLAGLLEIAVLVLIIISLAKAEFTVESTKPWLKTALGVAAITFVLLSVGQRISADFSGAASLFFFGATMATLLVVFHDERKSLR